MLPSQYESKIIVEATLPEFNWDNCPEKFKTLFSNVIASQETVLNLQNQSIFNPAEIITVCNFLRAYPHITTLDISGNYLSANSIMALALNKTLKDLRINDNMPLPFHIIKDYQPEEFLAARESEIMDTICQDDLFHYNLSLTSFMCNKNLRSTSQYNPYKHL